MPMLTWLIGVTSRPSETAEPLKLNVFVCTNAPNIVVSAGNARPNTMRFSPGNTCSAPPTVSLGEKVQLIAARTSAIPPELTAVTLDGTRSVPTTCVSWYVFVQVRSRKLVYDRLSRACPIRPLTRKSGKRAVTVLVFRPLPVTQRNSGSYCTYTVERLPTSNAAGLIGELASKSASDPPVASARVLSSPPG